MTRETFLKIINLHQEQDKRIDRLSEVINYDSPLVEFGWLMFDEIMREAFSEEQRDWISWWLYERISIINGEELPYFGEKGKKQYIHTPEELWDFIQDIK